jgi:hypothetical protein
MPRWNVKGTEEIAYADDLALEPCRMRRTSATGFVRP